MVACKISYAKWEDRIYVRRGPDALEGKRSHERRQLKSEPRWPVEYRNGSNRYGPDLDDHCPCGSLRRARSCHAVTMNRWKPTGPTGLPLIRGERTNYSNPDCYAACASDCSEQTNREHWLSRSILEQIEGKQFIVDGLHWQKTKELRASPKSLQSKVLCVRHNKALSPLDAIAGNLFRVCQEYQRGMQSESELRLFSMFNGHAIERWLLKFLLGGIASTSLRSKVRPEITPPTIIDHDDLIEGLFRGGINDLPITLYQDHENGRPITLRSDIELRAEYNGDGVVVGCGIAFGPAVIRLALGPVPKELPKRSIIVRPAGIVIESTVADAQAVAAFGWEQGDAEMTVYRYTGETSDDPAQRNGIFS